MNVSAYTFDQIKMSSLEKSWFLYNKNDLIDPKFLKGRVHIAYRCFFIGNVSLFSSFQSHQGTSGVS